MKQFPKYLIDIVECARTDELAPGDYPRLASHIKMCWPGLQEWLDDREFWETVTLAGFTQQMALVVADAAGVDKGLAKLVMSAIPNPTDRANSTRKAVQVMADCVYGFVQLGEDVAATGDPMMPPAILGHLFQGACGGVVVAAAVRQEASLSIRSSAFTSGLVAITDASKAIRTELAGKLSGFNG